MSKKPLLLFPSHKSTVREKLKSPFGQKQYHYPTFQQQRDRLTPLFESMQESFITDSANGLNPENVLVIETIGKIEDFHRAVRHIEGLEWLSEIDEDDISPDEDFYQMDRRDNLLSGRLFFSMSNKQAIIKIISLWTYWDSYEKKLPRNFAKWAEIFKQIKRIRKWDIEDRLRDTGIINLWEEEIELKKGTFSKITFEIELWYRSSKGKREEIDKNIKSIIIDDGGEISTSCIIEDIRFHGIKAKLPIDRIEKVLNHEYTKLFNCNDIMFFRAAGQCKINLPEDSLQLKEFDIGITSGNPIVAILDGLPFTNHNLLRNRLIVEDPDNFEDAYQANERKHGTSMASLICHGELDAHEEPLKRPIYVRPIMKPDEEDFRNRTRNEIVPRDYFLEDLIERSVRSIFKGEDDEKASAPSIKVINISICDSSKMFFNQISSCARLLDWLSYKYSVLFCVSAGNITSNIKLNKNIQEVRILKDDELVKITLEELCKDKRIRKILSPAESINSITVGASHMDYSTIKNLGNRIDILPDEHLPSPISAHGLGHKNSIKPEIYMSGGRQLYEEIDEEYQISKSLEPPGQCVAATSLQPGDVNKCLYTRGTSNANALATRSIARIYEMLNELFHEKNISIDETNISVILKSLIVHSSMWSNYGLKIKSILDVDKRNIARYCGYGIPKIERVLECTSQRATVIGYGKIKKDEKHEFILPLPPSLSGIIEERRLIVTLAWFSPINSSNRKYRKANLSIDTLNEKIGVPKRVNADGNQVKNGTVQHEVFEGKQVIQFLDGENLKISVICREDAENLKEEIYYGLAVTIEVLEEIDIPIYEEIKERISIKVPVEEKISEI
jgi:hypothetical protein